MKLTGKLKENVVKAESKEQAKELIAKAGMELTDEEMDMVSGGFDIGNKKTTIYRHAPGTKGKDHQSDQSDN